MTLEIESLIKETIQNQFGDAINSLIKEGVSEFLQNKFTTHDLFTDPKTAETIRSYASQYTSTEIGNRLRCGLYDNTLFQKVFDEHFDNRFREQIRSEIRRLVSKEIDIAIKEYSINAVKVNK